MVGDILSVNIAPQGWYAELLLESLSDGGSYSFGIDAANKLVAPKIAFNVTSLGFTDTGIATTITRIVYGTIAKRKIYPNDTYNDEEITGSNVIIRIALNEYIYSDDVVTVDILSGLYSQGGNDSTAISNLSVTNNCVEAYPKVVGNWTITDRDIIQDGFTLSCIAAHNSVKEGRPVRGVTFTITDQHSHTVTATVTETTKVLNAVSGIYSAEYVYSIDTATLTDGDTLDFNFRAFPFYGNEASCLNTADGVNTYPSKKYSKRQFKLDKTHVAYGRAVAVVDSVAGSSPAVVALPDFNSSTPPDAYATIAAAINAIVTFNTNNYGRSNCSGGIIYLKEGTHAWSGGTNAPGTTEFMLIIEKFPDTVRDNVIIGSVSGDNDAGSHTKFKDVYLNNSASIFTDETFVIFENCRVNLTGSAPFYTTPSYNYVVNCIVDAGTTRLNGYGIAECAVIMVKGCLIADGSNAYLQTIVIIGNKSNGTTASISGTYHTTSLIDNAIVAFNSVLSRSGATVLCALAAVGTTTDLMHGALIMQNSFERATGGAANSAPLCQFAADSTGTPTVNNVMIWNNTFVGQRVNYAYNDYVLNGVGPAWRKFWSLHNNIFQDWNIVTDNDSHGGTPNASRYGNHSLIHGCGYSGNICTDEVGTADYNPMFSGINSLTSDAGNITVDFIDDKSSSINGDTLGGGDYNLGDDSAAIDLAYKWCVKNDLQGRNRSFIDDLGAFTRIVIRFFSACKASPSKSLAALSVIDVSNINAIVKAGGSKALAAISVKRISFLTGAIKASNCRSTGSLVQGSKTFYLEGLNALLLGDISLRDGNITCILLDNTYVVSAGSHKFISDIGTSSIISQQALNDKEVSNAIFNAADVLFYDLPEREIFAFVLAQDTGDIATSQLIAYSTLPPTYPEGDSIRIVWNNGVNKILRLLL